MIDICISLSLDSNEGPGKGNTTVGQFFSSHSAPFFVLGLQYVVAIRDTEVLDCLRNALMIQYSTVHTTTQMPRQRYSTTVLFGHIKDVAVYLSLEF